jgi:hypothetical protein
VGDERLPRLRRTPNEIIRLAIDWRPGVSSRPPSSGRPGCSRTRICSISVLAPQTLHSGPVGVTRGPWTEWH